MSLQSIRQRRLRVASSALLLLVALAAAPAHAWWDDAWTLRKQIVLDTSGTGANVADAAANVPVLVRLHAGNFSRFADLKPDGSDIRFVGADDKTPLPFHIERLDIQQELALIWVLAPQVAGNSNQNALHMYFGNAKATASGSSSGTFPDDFRLVLHFDDAQGAVRDATRHANHASSGSVRPFAAGIVGYAAAFDGSVLAGIGASSSLTFTPDKGATVSLWVNLERGQDDAVVLDLRDAVGAALTLAIANQTPYATYRATTDAVPAVARNDGTAILPKTWTHLSVAIGGGKLVLRVNGVESASVPITMVAPLAANLQLGALADGSRALNGAQVDELRIVQGVTAEPAAKLEIASEGVGGSLLTYGADAGPDDGAQEPSYFLITLQNVTIDGWVVIGILALMFVVSLLVIVTKALMLSTIRRENRSFLEEFRRIADKGIDVLDQPETEADRALAEKPLRQALGGHGKFAASSIYHLYHLGIAETRKRTSVRAVGSALSQQTMDAIRAALHAANIRESQKLNANMVLLTLSISGGPFLGLLGTVLGVMITFAAIAYTGEVDVASIAPGTAAALAATVAGLVVAIPALFAYNYFTIRIREITADNEVFLDEFVTRVAEQYS